MYSEPSILQYTLLMEFLVFYIIYGKMCLYPDIKTVLRADIGIRNYKNVIHVYTLSQIKKQVLPY